MTGYASDEVTEAFNALGVLRILAKPIDIVELHDGLAVVFGEPKDTVMASADLSGKPDAP